jgi:hypothetical protein
MQNNRWARLLAYVTGLVNQRLLLECEYLIVENRILRSHVSGRLRLSDAERSTLAEIGKRLGRKCLAEVACVAKPETILAWYRRLIARKFDGSRHRSYPGRPRVGPELEALILRMAQENKGWGYDRIAGALANLGHQLSDQTIGNILKRHGIAPAPKRSQSTSWKDFIAAHMAVLAGTDFFTIEVLTWRGLVTYYVLFFLHLETRRVTLAGITRHPTETWMTQMARDAVDDTACPATIRAAARRVDSRLLLPARGRCLMNVLPVEFRHGGRQKREATEFGNQTRTDPGDRGAVPLRRGVREEKNPRRIHQRDGLSSEARDPRVEADQRGLPGAAAALAHLR